MWQSLCPAESLNSCQEGARTCFYSAVALFPLQVKWQGHHLLTFIWLHLTEQCCLVSMDVESLYATKLNSVCTIWPQVGMCEFLMEQGVLIDSLVYIERYAFLLSKGFKHCWFFLCCLYAVIFIHFCLHGLLTHAVSHFFPPTHNENKRKADSCSKKTKFKKNHKINKKWKLCF